VDLLCQTSNVNSPTARWTVRTSCWRQAFGDSDASADGIEAAVERQVHRWDPSFPWGKVATSLGVVRHPFAQFGRLLASGARCRVLGLGFPTSCWPVN